MSPLIMPVVDFISNVLDKFVTTPEEKAKAQFELMKLAQEGEFKKLEADMQVALGQIDVNKVEAMSDSKFKSWWRPAAGWVGVLGMFYQFFMCPMLDWASTNFGWSAPPYIITNDLWVILAGLLGIGGFRSLDKIKGVSK